MLLRLRAVVALATALLVVLTISGPAHAQEGPDIDVTPDAGLEDGQTVTISGTGFDPAAVRWPGSVCLAEVLDSLPSVTQVNSLCGRESVVEVTPNATGAFTTGMVVHQVQQAFLGGTIDCRRSGCIILFLVLVGPEQALRAWAAEPITFGPRVPQSKGECKNGGWRNLANEQGVPFRNQGQCVSYVARRA